MNADKPEFSAEEKATIDRIIERARGIPAQLADVVGPEHLGKRKLAQRLVRHIEVVKDALRRIEDNIEDGDSSDLDLRYVGKQFGIAAEALSMAAQRIRDWVDAHPQPGRLDV